jgi:hypothetical protein
MRSQLIGRLHRLAVTLAPLMPIAVTLVVFGKRW